mgnify:CR=1 FL=1
MVTHSLTVVLSPIIARESSPPSYTRRPVPRRLEGFPGEIRVDRSCLPSVCLRKVAGTRGPAVGVPALAGLVMKTLRTRNPKRQPEG